MMSANLDTETGNSQKKSVKRHLILQLDLYKLLALGGRRFALRPFQW